ncbi:MAG: hypothetical protein U0414_30130 [Polyangiaceae bacterium]
MLDVRDGQTTTYSYGAASSKPFFPSDRFVGWVGDSREASTLVDVDARGVTYVVPGSIAGLLEDGTRTIALLTVDGIGSNRWSVNQLWDVSLGRGVGQPWAFERSVTSPDGCWAWGASPEGAQFVVDHRTAVRRIVGQVESGSAVWAVKDPFSPDSSKLTVFSRDGGIQIADVQSGAVSAALDTKECRPIATARLGPSARGSREILVIRVWTVGGELLYEQ